jgi:hypothetical protein
MTVPVGMLVGFAVWTVLLLLATVGVYRWSRILTGRVPIRNFRADQIEGAYKHKGQVLILDHGRYFDYGRWHGSSIAD